MGAYDPLVLAIQQRRQLFVAYLVRLDLKSAPQFLWTGAGPFRDVNGQVWSGVGVLGQISDIDRALVSAKSPTLTLSGLEPGGVAAAMNASDEVKGRAAVIFEQYFDESQAPVGAPLAIWNGIMDRIQSTINASESSIAIETATVLYRRRRPALAYLSDATQQTLYPGDTGCSEIARLVQAQENWPNY